MVASWLVARFPGGEVTGYHSNKLCAVAIDEAHVLRQW